MDSACDDTRPLNDEAQANVLEQPLVLPLRGEVLSTKTTSYLSSSSPLYVPPLVDSDFSLTTTVSLAASANHFCDDDYQRADRLSLKASRHRSELDGIHSQLSSCGSEELAAARLLAASPKADAGDAEPERVDPERLCKERDASVQHSAVLKNDLEDLTSDELASARMLETSLDLQALADDLRAKLARSELEVEKRKEELAAREKEIEAMREALRAKDMDRVPAKFERSRDFLEASVMFSGPEGGGHCALDCEALRAECNRLEENLKAATSGSEVATVELQVRSLTKMLSDIEKRSSQQFKAATACPKGMKEGRTSTASSTTFSLPSALFIATQQDPSESVAISPALTISDSAQAFQSAAVFGSDQVAILSTDVDSSRRSEHNEADDKPNSKLRLSLNADRHRSELDGIHNQLRLGGSLELKASRLLTSPKAEVGDAEPERVDIEMLCKERDASVQHSAALKNDLESFTSDELANARMLEKTETSLDLQAMTDDLKAKLARSELEVEKRMEELAVRDKELEAMREALRAKDIDWVSIECALADILDTSKRVISSKRKRPAELKKGRGVPLSSLLVSGSEGGRALDYEALFAECNRFDVDLEAATSGSEVANVGLKVRNLTKILSDIEKRRDFLTKGESHCALDCEALRAECNRLEENLEAATSSSEVKTVDLQVRNLTKMLSDIEKRSSQQFKAAAAGPEGMKEERLSNADFSTTLPLLSALSIATQPSFSECGAISPALTIRDSTPAFQFAAVFTLFPNEKDDGSGVISASSAANGFSSQDKLSPLASSVVTVSCPPNAASLSGFTFGSNRSAGSKIKKIKIPSNVATPPLSDFPLSAVPPLFTESIILPSSVSCFGAAAQELLITAVPAAASGAGSDLPPASLPAFTFGSDLIADSTATLRGFSFSFSAASADAVTVIPDKPSTPLAASFGDRLGEHCPNSTISASTIPNARQSPRKEKNNGFPTPSFSSSQALACGSNQAALLSADFDSPRCSEHNDADDKPDSKLQICPSSDLDALPSRIPWSASTVQSVTVGEVTLRAHDFGPLVESLQRQHVKGTRKWVSEAFLDWLLPGPPSASPSQLFCVLGAAGTGKSVVTVAVLQQLLAKGKRVGAVHFCRHDNPSASSPEALVSSISAQLCGTVPGFEAALRGDEAKLRAALDLNDANTLFEAIIADPFRAVSNHALEVSTIIAIDALDELPPAALLSVLNLLSHKFIQLPPSVKLFVTSREEARIMKVFSKFNPLQLRVDEMRNKQDLRIFLSSVAADSLNLVITMKDVIQRVSVKWPGFYVADRLRDLQRLEELEEPMLQSRACYDVVADSILSEPGYKELCKIDEVSPWPPMEQKLRAGAGPDQLSELMVDAAEARMILRMIISRRWEPMSGKPTKLVPVTGCAVPWVDNAVDPGLKGQERAIEKTLTDYRGNFLLLRDIARISLEFNSCSRLLEGFLALTKCPGVKIVSVKNKFMNSTPLGYRDLSLTVEVSLCDGRKHLCEVQMNHTEMLVAKSKAHRYYEVVRRTLPLICKSLGSGTVGADEVEKFIMDILFSSVLESALKVLEDKAEGLFIYARLLETQLQEARREAGGRLVDFSALKDLPGGLGEMYENNFMRIFSKENDWDASKKVVAMIAVAREPLPETFVEKILGGEEYILVKRSLSLLFPVRDGRLHVMHKSVVDWLNDSRRVGQRFWLSTEDNGEASATLARQLWFYEGWRSCGVDDSWDYEMEEGEKYAVTYGHVHFKEAVAWERGSQHKGYEEGVVKEVVRAWHAALLRSRTADRSRTHLIRDGAKPGGAVHRIESETLLRRRFCFLSFMTARAYSVPINRTCIAVVTIAVARFYMFFERLHVSAIFVALVFFLAVVTTASFFHSSSLAAANGAPGVAPKPANKYQFSTETATKASGLLIMRQAKMGRIKKFTAELWELLVEVAKLETSCEKAQQFTRLVEDKVAVLGATFNPAFIKVERSVFKDAARKMLLEIPMSSSLTRSAFADSMLFLKKGQFKYDLNLPVRVSHSLFLMELIGHFRCVYSVAFSSDGTRIVSGSLDKTVKVWNASTGDVENTLEGHSEGVYSVAFSSDGMRIVSGSLDKTVKVWNTASGDIENTLEGHSEGVYSVAFSSDGMRIASGSWDTTVKIWNAASGDVVSTLTGHSSTVLAVAFSPDGIRIVSGSDDTTVKIWNAETGDLEYTLEGHRAAVTSVAFSSDGSRIVSGGYDKTIKIWIASTGDILSIFLAHSRCVNSVAISRDGMRILSGSDDNRMRIWNGETGALDRDIAGHSNGVQSLALSHDGTRIVSGSRDKTVKVWSAVTKTIEDNMVGHSSYVTVVAFFPDGSRIVSGGCDKTIMIWNASTGDIENILQGHRNSVTSIAISRDGMRVVSGSDDTSIKIWNAATGDLFKTLSEHTGSVNFVAFSPDETKIVSGSDDKSIKIWNAATGDLKSTLKGHREAVTSVSFSSDGLRIFSVGGDKSVKIWDAATGENKNSIFGDFFSLAVAFSFDGTRIAYRCSDHAVRISNAETGEVEATLEVHFGLVHSVAFSSDGSRVVLGGSDNAVRVWKVETGEVETTLEGHFDRVFSVAFSRDGSRIVSGSKDNTVKIWNVVTGEVENSVCC